MEKSLLNFEKLIQIINVKILHLRLKFDFLYDIVNIINNGIYLHIEGEKYG